jgi:hypothetical protein
MAKQYECRIPRPSRDPLLLILETGRSVVVVGANGSGKTRLGVHIESSLLGTPIHRVAAHKSLALSDSVSLISLERADRQLRFGYADGDEKHRFGQRWGGKPATHLLNDFEALLQKLFAEHNRAAVVHLRERRSNSNVPVPTTKLNDLKGIWDGLMPHRELETLEASIRVRPGPADDATTKVSYAGSEMSDGERSIFYFLGQCLLAPDSAVIVIDEPEGHIHKAILWPLWDAIEKARPDCSFVYITHDLDFAASRTAATRYFIRAYNHDPIQWDIDNLPEETGIPEQIVVELVGSRKPILFVEGERGSLDLTVYRSHYANFTVIPVGSCDAVVRSVNSYRGSKALHWLNVRGLVDADHRDAADIAFLEKLDIYVLPVAEVENLLLLPDVFIALASAFSCADPAAQLGGLTNDVLAAVSANLDLVCSRYAIRQLDRRLKRVEVEAKDLETLQKSYKSALAPVDPTAIFVEIKKQLEKSIQARDLGEVLRLYDNKGLLARGASRLGLRDQKQLLEKVGRLMGGENGQEVRRQLAKALPPISM